MNIVIVAGGLGSRLAPLTNHIPKFLVNIGKQTGYVEQVRYWQRQLEGISSLTVIVHSSYAALIGEYHKLYFPDVPLIIKTVDVANGSAHAIAVSCEHLVGQKVFFQWCDVMPADDINRAPDVNTVYENFDHPNRYRMGWKDGSSYVPYLDPDGAGGVFGLYFVKEYKTVSFEPGQDFVEVIQNFGELKSAYLKSIVDWGDLPKLKRTRQTADAAREFNSVEFHGDLVLKRAINEQGRKLIAKEKTWYEICSLNECDVSIPEVFTGKDGFVMTRIDGVPVFQLWPDLDWDTRKMVLGRIIDQMNKLHSVKSDFGPEIVAADIKEEAFTKLNKRYAEIKGVIDAFGKIEYVNGKKLTEADPRVTIEKLYNKLATYYDGLSEYSVIHGDLQMSNTMINPDTFKISMIDPRGYFGSTHVYGLADYDVAKLLYSLSGYDLFNYSQDFGVERINTHLKFTIPTPGLEGCAELIEKTFQPVHQIWLAIIWIGLAQYIRSDPVKCVAAHYHGLVLAEKILSSTRTLSA